MKKSLYLLFSSICLTLFAACGYDDGPLWDRVNDIDSRLKTVEQMCDELNTNVSSLQSMLKAMADNDYIRSVTALKDASGAVIGYSIEFVKSGSVMIYHGQDGRDGQNGADGQDGADGRDGNVPQIAVGLHSDGNYYWTLDGQWLTDGAGNMIAASASAKDGQDGQDGQNGADGQDGADGKDGKDGLTPQLKIEDGHWFLSTDGGKTWADLGPAQGANGKDGADGKDGQDGKDGVAGETMFASVDYMTSTDYVTFTLLNGEVIKLPTWAAFEQLLLLCNQLNTNVSSLQALVNAQQTGDYITSVVPLLDNGTEVGYTISFAKSNPITIFHGQKGSAAEAPAISVKTDADGKYYWTVNGQWLLDEQGAKIPAQGADGKDGQNGADGKDGKDCVAPQLKIEDGNWLLSTDGGKTWENLGPATGRDGKDGVDGTNGADGQDGIDGTNGADGKDGKDGDTIFSAVTQTENSVTFTLADGSEIVIPKNTSGALKISFSQQFNIPVWIDKETEITYTVTGNAGKPVYLRVIGDAAHLQIKRKDDSSGTIIITPKHGAAETEMSSAIEACCEDMVSGVKFLTYEWDISRNDNVFIFKEENGASFYEWWDDSVVSEGYFSVNKILETEEDRYTSLGWSVAVLGNDQNPLTEVGEWMFNHLYKTYPCRDADLTSSYNYRKGCCNIILPSGIKKIGRCAFRGCSYVELNDAIEEIGVDAFAYCTFKELKLPKNLVSIGRAAFRYLTLEINEITIPQSVTSIGAGAFSNNENIVVTFEGITPPAYVSSIGVFDAGTEIRVPQGSVEAYKTAWSVDKNINTYNFVEY